MMAYVQNGLCHFCDIKTYHIWNTFKHYDLKSNRAEAESPLIVSLLCTHAAACSSLNPAVMHLLTWPGLSQRLPVKRLFQFLYVFLLQSSCLLLLLSAISPPPLRKKNAELIISLCTAFSLLPSCYSYAGAHCDPVSPRI